MARRTYIIDWPLLGESLLITATFAFMAMCMAVVGLAFAGDNVLDDVPFLFHVAVFCIIWALFSWLTIDWSMIIEKEELE